MFLVYADESGNRGYTGSQTYVVGGVFLEDEAWPQVFDEIVQFRRFLRDRFGLLLRDEIKADYLLRNVGPFTKLNHGDKSRHKIYRLHMRLLPKLGLNAFAIVINKELIMNQSRDPRDIAWEFFIQRMERLTTKSGKTAMLIHDEGDTETIRKLFRKARRINMPGSAFGLGKLSLPARLVLEDPVPRNSSRAYLIQFADLVAYAAFRTMVPPLPGTRQEKVCPATMWAELGSACFAEANALSGGVPGVVSWP